MKTLDLPAAASALPISSDPAELAPNPNGKAPAQNFDELMGQAMATNDSATETADSETPAENNAPGHSTDKTKTPEPASASAVEMIAAMVLPAVLPIVAITTTASSSAQDAIESISSDSGSPAEGDIAAECPLSEVPTEIGASTTTLPTATSPAPTSPVANSPTAVPQVVGPMPTGTANAASIAISTSSDPNAQVETPITELVAPSSSMATPNPAAASDANASIPLQAVPSAEVGPDSTVSQPADTTADLHSAVPHSAEQNLPSENISTANQLLTRNNAPVETNEQMSEAVETAVDPDAVVQPTNAPTHAISAAGTSGAKYRSPMQKAEKQNEIAESAEQNLPVGASSVSTNAAAKPARAFNSASESEQSDAAGIGASNVTDSFGGKELKAVSPLADSPAPVNPARAVERTQDLMALHAFRLRDSGQDSMQVVIKPSPDLHLALNLQMRDGQMEVSAHLQRGDYEFLNRHWSDLQQQMEARGVRLAPLSNNESATGSGNFSQQPGRQSPEEKAAKTGAFAEFALASVLTPKRPAKAATVSRGWESWA